MSPALRYQDSTSPGLGSLNKGWLLRFFSLAIGLAVFVLVRGAVVAVCRGLRNRRTALLFAILESMLVCWLYWTVGFVVFTPQDSDPNVTLVPMKTRIQ